MNQNGSSYVWFTMVVRWIVAAIVVGQSCGTPPVSEPLSTGHLGVIRAETFVAVGRMADLPATVREALDRAFEEGSLPLLDPGESVPLVRVPWRTRRQLVIGACGPDHCLMQYTHAGAGRRLFLLVLGLNPDNAQVEWSGVTGQRATTVAALRGEVLRAAAER